MSCCHLNSTSTYNGQFYSNHLKKTKGTVAVNSLDIKFIEWDFFKMWFFYLLKETRAFPLQENNRKNVQENDDIGLKGSVVNRTCYSICRGLLTTTSAVPLRINYA